MDELMGKDNFIEAKIQMIDQWKEEMSQAYRQADRLLEFLGHPSQVIDSYGFPVLVTAHYASLMEQGNLQDPLLLQVLPNSQEGLDISGFQRDAVGDLHAHKEAGILQKYQGRVLVIPTAACAIHCRHCFRRNFPYATIQNQGFVERLGLYLQKNPDVEEVIFSGGDPLMVEDSLLKECVEILGSILSIKRVRFHSRLPVVLPSRFTPALLEILLSIRQEKIFVLHANHSNELESISARVLHQLREIGFTMLNQSVLLRNVNDSAKVLADLSRKLHSQGVLPYYLHQLDKATGVAHFEVPLGEGLQIHKELQAQLPGYLVPRYVQEIEGESGKTILGYNSLFTHGK